MKNLLKNLILTMIMAFCISGLKAQEQILGEGRFKHTVSDSLLTQFYNKVYRCFYTPAYINNITTTAAVLKVDINDTGKITAMSFSDSADSTFKRAFSGRKNIPADYVILEKYVAIKKYASQSLLIPVYFEPSYPNQTKAFTYDDLEGLWKFDKKNLTGASIIMAPIFIRVSKTGNM